MQLSTLNDLFFLHVARRDRPSALQVKRNGVYHGISGWEVVREVEAIANGLLARGLHRGDRVALLAENRPEWICIDLAILTVGGVTVPIYPSLLPAHIEHILRDSGARAIFCSSAAQTGKVLPLRQALPALEAVVQLDLPPPEGSVSLDALRAEGRAKAAELPELHRTRAAEVQSEDVATLIYTSGTTGVPKGVLLTHWGILSNILATNDLVELGEEDVGLSFLPLSHIFERMMHYAGLLRGASVAYAESQETLGDDIRAVRPTVLAGVPRFYEKLAARIQGAVASSSPMRRALFRWALAVGGEQAGFRIANRPVPAGLQVRLALAHALVLRKVQARVGGRLRLLLSGGAPLSRELALFFYALGFTVLEGYGLTETSPVICMNRPGATKPGTVGKPIPGVEVRLAEDGEILCKGPNVMKGYHNLPAETAEALRDGWFHTGDVGRFDEEGFLLITDRKKDLIRTSGGKDVAPQPLEAKLRESPLIDSAVIVGNRRRFVSALLVPNFAGLASAAGAGGAAGGTGGTAEAGGTGGGTAGDRAALLGQPSVRELFQRELDKLNATLPPYATVKKFALLDHVFSLESGELTPTMKLRRRVIEERFAETIEAMYREEA
ncbi:MAG: long-chain fatty acid--CoA ligase [Planctomycetes bacterium]|nr:long-chain fatty acid--CoA ligase [Planctomycetota bacterium]